MYNEQGATGLVTEEEVRKLQNYKQLTTADFHQRKEQFMKQKEEKILAQMIEKEDAELNGCTFAPESYTTKNNQ